MEELAQKLDKLAEDGISFIVMDGGDGTTVMPRLASSISSTSLRSFPNSGKQFASFFLRHLISVLYFRTIGRRKATGIGSTQAFEEQETRIGAAFGGTYERIEGSLHT